MYYRYCSYLLISLLSFWGISVEAYSQQQSVTHKVYEFKLHFPVNSMQLSSAYMDNYEQLKLIDRFIKDDPRIGDSLIIYSYASPEGPYWNNAKLSKGRGASTLKYLRAMFQDKFLADSVIFIDPTAENWEGLIEIVEKEYNLRDRDKVLSILKSNISTEEKKERLKVLSDGEAWAYIVKYYMPRLRYVKWVLKWQNIVRKGGSLPLSSGSYRDKAPQIGHTASLGSLSAPLKSSEKLSGRKTLFALKSNLLFDLATVLNFSVEIPFSRRFSILYQHHCPWWLSSNNKYCLQFLSFGGELRWWMVPGRRRDALSGHFLGLYGWGGKLDFQNDRKICYQAEFNSAGLSYGYSCPVSKRLNMEFSVSFGYAEIPYRHYIPSDDYEILIRDRNNAGTLTYIGPTKAEVSLVIPICSKSKERRNL